MEEGKKKRVRPTVAEVVSLKREIKTLREENSALSESNSLMEEELGRLRQSNKELIDENISLGNDYERLMSRSFLSRVLNRDV